ncbi:hypothetical protein OY671_010040, partial [Metschnikowia pulcherrima]
AVMAWRSGKSGQAIARGRPTRTGPEAPRPGTATAAFKGSRFQGKPDLPPGVAEDCWGVLIAGDSRAERYRPATAPEGFGNQTCPRGGTGGWVKDMGTGLSIRAARVSRSATWQARAEIARWNMASKASGSR